MALKKMTRRRAPLDGSWFRTTARLQSIMRAACSYDDEMRWPRFVEDTIVPVWVRMEKYKAQETRHHPDGMIYGPVIKVGGFESPEIELFGSHHSAGLEYDSTLDGHGAYDRDDRWIYRVIDGDTESGGQDVSVYLCDGCGKGLYRDDSGLRDHHSACLMDGSLVCRECEWSGLIIPSETVDQMSRCRELADHVGTECRRKLDANFEHLNRKESFGGRPTQTRLWTDGKWSFFWSQRIKADGEWKRGMHGGLIQHGPTPTLGDDGSFSFTTYDYGQKCVRGATKTEVENIEWCIHT